MSAHCRRASHQNLNSTCAIRHPVVGRKNAANTSIVSASLNGTRNALKSRAQASNVLLPAESPVGREAIHRQWSPLFPPLWVRRRYKVMTFALARSGDQLLPAIEQLSSVVSAHGRVS